MEHCLQLLRAAEDGRLEEVRRLAELGADVSSQDADGVTVLHQAACKGQVEAVRVLAELGADVHAQSVSGATALHWAAGAGMWRR